MRNPLLKLTKAIEKLLGWLHRFLICCATMGLRNAVTIFLQSRFSPKERVIRLPGGQRFVFRGCLDKGVVSHFYSEGYHFTQTDDEQICRILDCGANIGDETARFRAHHPNAEIIAVEPERDNFHMLERNFAHYQRIHLIHGGIWPCEGRLRIIPGTTPEGFRVAETGASGPAVPAWTIPQIMQKFGWNEIDILKIDIEGAEYELFSKNCEPWINKVKAMVFEVADNPASTQVIFRALDTDRFDTFICGENLVLLRRGVSWGFKRVVGIDTSSCSGSPTCSSRG